MRNDTFPPPPTTTTHTEKILQKSRVRTNKSKHHMFVCCRRCPAMPFVMCYYFPWLFCIRAAMKKMHHVKKRNRRQYKGTKKGTYFASEEEKKEKNAPPLLSTQFPHANGRDAC